MTATHVDWQRQAAALTVDGRAVVDGARISSQAGRTITTVNPATGALLGTLECIEAGQVDAVVQLARTAFTDGRWSAQSTEDRKAVMLRLAELLEEHREELALLDSLEMGKPIREAASVDVPGTAATFRFYAEALDKLVDEIPATPPGSTALVTREPLGVVAAITPWNYPLEIASWKVAPALAVGNSVIHKPATQSSLSMLRLAELALEAGLPAGVLNVIPGSGSDTGSALGAHSDVDVVAFTGSTTAGKQIMCDAGRSNMKRLSLEAGGKSANVVFADTENLPQAAEMAAAGAFYNQGEVCSANCRLLVERSIHDEFLALLTEASTRYYPGDPLDPASGTGSLVSQEHADQVWKAVDEATAAGKLLHGGNRITVNGMNTFIEPTIVGQLPPDHYVLHEEIFGPLLTVETFDTEDQALALANNTAYGLAASVWTGSVARAHRVAQHLHVGTVSVNTVDALGATTPFGGVKQSGFGRDLSLHALDNYTALKTTWIQFG